ncbi:MAG: hypothetical protein HQL95_09115 [Magnetococcales bacterium]|nr:hypothetical protein [Magnetococcales bacterium]
MNALSPSGGMVHNASLLLGELLSAGFSIHAESGNLRVSPSPDAVMTERIRQCKPELLAILTPRLLTDDEQTDIDRVFADFKNLYGHTLVEAGWNRDLVFGGLDPLAAVTVDDVPGIIAILRSGGVVEAILPNRILLRDGQNRRLAWLWSGGFLGGKCLQQLENEEMRNV